MENSIFVYLFSAIVNRIECFIKDWYPNSFFKFWNFLLNTLKQLDKTFAIKVTIRHWLKPLYQDETIIGYILGFIFRTIRIILAALIYLMIFIIVLSLYLIWAAVPIFLIIKIFI
jgi:hypothetical protein